VSATGDVRSVLFATLDGIMPTGRVHLYPPAQAVTPCVWIDVPEKQTRALSRSTATVVAFSIYIVVDGADRAQVEALDLAGDEAWDRLAAVTGLEPISQRPLPRDVGGPTLRGIVLDVETQINRRMLCGPVPLPLEVPA
jgi:hypothetical protein